MKRRDFVSLLGGAAIAWPRAARAQQAQRMRRIGVLMNLPAGDPETQARNAAFLQELQQLGWTVGHNVRIDYRWGGGDADRYRRYAATSAETESRDINGLEGHPRHPASGTVSNGYPISRPARVVAPPAQKRASRLRNGLGNGVPGW